MWHRKYIEQALRQPFNDCPSIVTITADPMAIVSGGAAVKAIGVHQLTPAENGGNHHVYVELLDEQGQQERGWRLLWDWEGRRVGQVAQPALADKPLSEPGTNIAMEKGMVVSCWLEYSGCDKVGNLRTDMVGAGGGNSLFHWSYLVIFKRVSKATPSPDPVPLPGHPLPDPENPAPHPALDAIFIPTPGYYKLIKVK